MPEELRVVNSLDASLLVGVGCSVVCWSLPHAAATSSEIAQRVEMNLHPTRGDGFPLDELLLGAPVGCDAFSASDVMLSVDLCIMVAISSLGDRTV